MAKGGRTQIGPRLSDDALTILTALQQHYAQRAGVPDPLSQAQVLEIVLRETEKRLGLKIKGLGK